MNCIIRNPDNTEVRVSSENELIEMANQGKILPNTPVKKALLRDWITAEELSFLKDSFAKYKTEDEKKNEEKAEEKTTSFVRALEPVRASMGLRTLSWIFDLCMILLIFAACAAAGTAAAAYMNETKHSGPHMERTMSKRSSEDEAFANKKKAAIERAKKKSEETGTAEAPELPVRKAPAPIHMIEKNFSPSAADDERAGFHFGSFWLHSKKQTYFVCLSAAEGKALWCPEHVINRVMYGTAACFILLAILYIFLPMMFRAQTAGMHYFGIFLSNSKDPAREVLEIRAFFYTLLSLLTIFLTPLFLLVRQRTLAERITGTTVIRISAKRTSD